MTYRKTAHPRNSEEPQGYEPTVVADTLNVFDNSESRTPILIVERDDGDIVIKEETVVPFEGNGTRPSHKGNGYGKPGDPSFTLNAVEQHGVAYSTAAVMCLNDQGGSQMSVTNDVTATLRAQEHGHQPLCLDMTGTKPVVTEDGTSYPLTACMGSGGNRVHAVVNYVGVGGEVANTIDANYFKGPGNNWAPREVVAMCVGNGQLNDMMSPTVEASKTLSCMHDPMNVMVQSAVRRLTPRECERLMAFPDDWTNIGEWTDSKGKRHKETSDSNRYKSLGNSIALPFWQWLLNNISDTYKGNERPTLGSLFDGIGGFPLCWERRNGKGTAVWASEIDEFCIAVTNKRFNESEVVPD